MRNRQKYAQVLLSLFTAVLLFVLCSQFSYFVDDWYWGTDSRLETFFDSFSSSENPFHFYNNGRYLGNLLGFISANHTIFRNLIMTAVLWGIIRCTAEISLNTAEIKKPSAAYSVMFLLCGTLLLLSPKEMIRESLGWSVAFMIYVVPCVLYLICLKMLFSGNSTPASDLLLFCLLFISSFFIENLSIGSTIFILLRIAFRLISKKRPSRRELFYLAGSISGLICMFADDGYHQIFTGTAEETYWGAQTGSILAMVQTGAEAFKNFIAGAVTGRMTVLTAFTAVTFTGAYLLYRGKLSQKSRTVLFMLSLLDTVTAVYFLVRKASPSWEVFFSFTKLFDAILVILFLFSIPLFAILLPCKEKQKDVIFSTWLFTACITAPLLVAEPLSMRVFFPTSVFLMLTGCEAACINLKEFNVRISPSFNKKFLPYLFSVFLFSWAYLFSVYAVIAHYEQERIKYVRYRESLGYYHTDFPKLPYEEYVIISYPWGETWQERYKKFHGLNLDMRFNIVPFDEWKEQLRQES